VQAAILSIDSATAVSLSESNSFNPTRGRPSSVPTRWGIWCAGVSAAPPALACSSIWRRASRPCAQLGNPGSSERGRDEPALPISEEFEFKIIRLNEAEKKIGLSMQAVADDEERSRLEDYHRQAAALR